VPGSRVSIVAPLLLLLGAGAGDAPSTPVLVELFTSEGCSSCPPADALLARLQAEQPIRGVEVIALAQHVDYWNDLGWTDPFTTPGATERQRAYGRTFGLDAVYTPQLVIAGRRQLVGGNEAVAFGAIRAAADDRRAHLTLRAIVAKDGQPIGSVRFEIASSDLASAKGQGPADVLLALVEHGLAADVRTGENAGLRLRHDGVVRQLDVVGQVREGQSELRITTPELVLRSRWNRANLSAVAFVQDRKSRHVLAVARTPIS
jgi:hypothetical protein